MAREPDEPFELLEPLGRGGFACTYLARVVDPDLRDEYQRDEVALKVPLGRREERVLRHEMELNAGLHMRLKSENLVRYLGFTVFRGRIVMVMEYVPEGASEATSARSGTSGACRPARPSGSPSERCAGWRSSMPSRCSIGTSSPRTSCSPRACPRSPTSGSPVCSIPTRSP